MNDVCEYIVANYTTNNYEYILQEDTSLDYDLDTVVSILTTTLSDDISIIEKSYDDFKINIKFSYKQNIGYISSYYHSRGYDYLVVSFGE
jgi:hypothetical protein